MLPSSIYFFPLNPPLLVTYSLFASDSCHLCFTMQCFCSAAAEPDNQKREHKLTNKFCFQHCADNYDDTDHKEVFLSRTE